MKYAVIRLGGKQYKVKEKEEILTDKVDKDKVSYETLLLVDDDKVEVGKPVLEKAEVKIKHLGDPKGEKIYIQKFKAKSRYRRRTGFRASYSKLLIEKISVKS